LAKSSADSPGPSTRLLTAGDLGAAQIIVSVGRGIKEAANIPVVQKLADALGAELAIRLQNAAAVQELVEKPCEILAAGDWSPALVQASSKACRRSSLVALLLRKRL